MFYFDPLYLLISLPAFLIGLGSTLFLKFIYSQYSKTGNVNNLTGLDAVTRIAEGENFDIKIEMSGGNLSDHYNPMNKTVALSADVSRVPSVASVGIAAHEMGHVAQHQKGFLLIGIRTLLAPIVGIGSNLGYFLIILGLILNFLNLAYLGLILFSLATVFALLTLPVEIDASFRGIALIKKYNLVGEYQIGGVRMVLFAAALTYVASLFQSISQLLYFFLRVQGSRSRD